MVAETTGTTVTNKYYRGANGIMYADLDGTKRRYLKDAHGNVTGLAYFGTEALKKTYIYDAFGVEINKDDSDTNPFRYCGEYYDNELDKIYLRARYYSPIQGRFMTEDPIKDGLNWYAYCAGDPVNAWDPMGLEAGDVFDSADDAAVDFGECYYEYTEYTYMEYASYIYEITDENGDTKYTYTEPVKGAMHGLTKEVEDSKPSGVNVVGLVHNHPKGKTFSTADKEYARINKMAVYAVAPGETVKIGNKTITKKRVIRINLDVDQYYGDPTVVKENIRVKRLSYEKRLELYRENYSAYKEHDKNCRYSNIYPCISDSWTTELAIKARENAIKNTVKDVLETVGMVLLPFI